jgi:hypothetical protein
VRTPPLPAGNYLVHYSVGAVLGPNDNLVCSGGPASRGNDGLFATAGNGAKESGTGAGGVYGTAVMTDTFTRVRAGERVVVSCNVGHFGQGTYVAGASIVALEVGTILRQTT